MTRRAHLATFAPAYTDPVDKTVVVKVECRCGDKTVGTGATPEEARDAAALRWSTICLNRRATDPSSVLTRALAGGAR